jgi:hypothetical protein
LSEQEIEDLKTNRDRSIIELLESMKIEKRLQDILLYALGMIGAAPELTTSADFF